MLKRLGNAASGWDVTSQHGKKMYILGEASWLSLALSAISPSRLGFYWILWLSQTPPTPLCVEGWGVVLRGGGGWWGAGVEEGLKDPLTWGVLVSLPKQCPLSLHICNSHVIVGHITPGKFMSYILRSLNTAFSALVTLDLFGVSITKCSHIPPHPSNRRLIS